MSRSLRASVCGAAGLVLAACGLDVLGVGAAPSPGPEAETPETAPPPPPLTDAAVDAFVPPDGAMPQDAAPDASCLEGEIAALGKCYRLVTTAQNELASAATCADAGGYLVTLTTLEELAFAADAGAGLDYWVGLKAADNPDNQRSNFRWANGEMATFDGGWYGNDPDGNGRCVALHGTLHAFVDRDCNASHAFICERAP